jgi:hypothetical protein
MGHGYYPRWLDNLADDVTFEAAAMDGTAHGVADVRSIVVAGRELYENQQFSYAGLVVTVLSWPTGGAAGGPGPRRDLPQRDSPCCRHLHPGSRIPGQCCRARVRRHGKPCCSTPPTKLPSARAVPAGQRRALSKARSFGRSTYKYAVRGRDWFTSPRIRGAYWLIRRYPALLFPDSVIPRRKER